MNILITGGGGYIGSRLSEFLSTSEEHQVFIGTRRADFKTSQMGMTSIKIDWTSPDSITSCCVNMDVIVHLAAMNADGCNKDASEALLVNGVYTARLLNAAKLNGVKRFIYLSTAHVYGSPLTGIITEHTCPFPIHPYATSHKAAEDLVLASHRRGDMDGIVLRLSNSFGAPISPDVDCWSLLFNDICKQVITQKSITLRSSGLQRRDFVPMTDVCGAIKHMLDVSLVKFDKPLFNIGGNWAPTIFEVALLVADRFETITGFRPVVNRVAPLCDEKSTDLIYSLDRVLSTGFCLQTDRLKELDNLIDFCKDSF